MDATNVTMGKQFWKFDNKTLESALSYDARISKHPFNNQMYDKLVTKLLQENIDAEAGRVLDAGGGTGKWALPIAELGHEVTLLDISEAMLEVARRNIVQSANADRLHLVQGDMRAMTFEENQFDFIISDRNSLSFCGGYEDGRRAIEECFRVLKPGKRFFASVHNRFREVCHSITTLDFVKARALFENGDFTEPNGQVVHYFTAAELRDSLEAAGFVNIKMYPTTVFTEFIPTAWVLDESVIKELYYFEENGREHPELLGMGVRLHFIAEKP